MKEEELVEKTISLFQQHKYAQAIDLLLAHTKALQPLLELEKTQGKKTTRESKQLKDLSQLRALITKRMQAWEILVISDQENMRRLIEGIIFYLSIISPDNMFKKPVIYAASPA